MYEKKGQLGGAISATITLVVGVGVAVLVLIFVGTLGGQTYELVEPDLDAIGVAAGSTSDLTLLNSTSTSLTHSALTTTPQAYQAGSLIGANNFTFNLEAGTVTLVDNTYNNTAFNFTYSWRNETVGGSVKRGMLSSFNALEQVGDYLPLIVLAIIIGLVLTLVVGLSFARTNGKGGGSGAVL